MEGKKDDIKNYGIIPNSFAHVFLEISKASKDVGLETNEIRELDILNKIIWIWFRYLVNVSYLEIYNEEIRDLLGKDRDKSLEVIIYEKTSKLLKIVFM